MSPLSAFDQLTVSVVGEIGREGGRKGGGRGGGGGRRGREVGGGSKSQCPRIYLHENIHSDYRMYSQPLSSPPPSTQ